MTGPATSLTKNVVSGLTIVVSGSKIFCDTGMLTVNVAS